MENKIKTLQQDISILQNIIETAHYFKGSIFFKPPANAAGRRSYEQRYSIPEHRIEFNGNVYTAAFTVICTCSNVYAQGSYTRNGDKCNLTVIKNLLTLLEGTKYSHKHMECFVNGHCCYDCPNLEVQMVDEKYGYGIADDMGLKEIKCSECYWEKNAECIDCLFADTENCSCNFDGGGELK